MRHLAERPLGLVVVAFAGGIALASALGAWALAWVAGMGAVVGIFLILRERRVMSSWIAALGAVATGVVVFLVTQSPPGSDISHLPQGGQTLIGTVANAPRRSGSWQTFVLKAESHTRVGINSPRSDIHVTTSDTDQVSGRLLVILQSSLPVRRGERWRLTGQLRPLRRASNPGQRGEDVRLASLGVTGVLTVGSEELGVCLGDGKLNPISRHAYAAQRRALKSLEKYMPGPYGGLGARIAASVVFGIHAAPPPREISAVFRQAGTIHLLVVSGAMVSIVFGLVFLPGMLGLRWRRALEEHNSGWPVTGRGRVSLRPGATAALLGIIAVTYYAVLTEGGQAVLRAAVMGVLIALGLLLRRTPQVARAHGLNIDSYTLVAAAALVVLVVEPKSLFQAGFQLSFAAVLSILYLTPKLTWALGWLPHSAGQLVGGTIAAQLGTFPLLAWHFGQAPVAGFGANLLAVPLAGVVLAGAMGTCAAGTAAPWLAAKAGWVTGMAARGLVWISSAFAGLPGAVVEMRPGLGWVLACYGAIVLAGLGLDHLRERLQQPLS